MIAALLIGFGLGASVAAQLGPMSLLTIRSTLRNGVWVGLAIGAGIAVIDTLYAAAGAAGAGVVLSFEPIRVVAGIVGAVVLVYLGAKTLWSAFRIRLGGETGDGAGDAEAGVRRRARRDRLEPAHDRVVGGGLRRGRAPRARPRARRC